jgi:hypothetical protein
MEFGIFGRNLHVVRMNHNIKKQQAMNEQNVRNHMKTFMYVAFLTMIRCLLAPLSKIVVIDVYFPIKDTSCELGAYVEFTLLHPLRL